MKVIPSWVINDKSTFTKGAGLVQLDWLTIQTGCIRSWCSSALDSKVRPKLKISRLEVIQNLLFLMNETGTYVVIPQKRNKGTLSNFVGHHFNNKHNRKGVWEKAKRENRDKQEGIEDALTLNKTWKGWCYQNYYRTLTYPIIMTVNKYISSSLFSYIASFLEPVVAKPVVLEHDPFGLNTDIVGREKCCYITSIQ